MFPAVIGIAIAGSIREQDEKTIKVLRQNSIPIPVILDELDKNQATLDTPEGSNFVYGLFPTPELQQKVLQYLRLTGKVELETKLETIFTTPSPAPQPPLERPRRARSRS
jgi:hypothetical protein